MEETLANAVSLPETLAEAVLTCIRKGMKLPFIVCAISPNGCIQVFRFKGPGTEMEVLAESDPDARFGPPMTVVVLDQHNDAAKLVMEPENLQGVEGA
jgi:hypothetical protein